MGFILSDGLNEPSKSKMPKWPLGDQKAKFPSTILNKIFILFNYIYLITASSIWQEVLKLFYFKGFYGSFKLISFYVLFLALFGHRFFAVHFRKTQSKFEILCNKEIMAYNNCIYQILI